MENNQPIEKRHLNADGVLQVHSVFRTIQGEGPFTGRAAVFIRLTGCNLRCPACDTDYTSSRWLATPAMLLEVMEEQRHPPSFVVITGGEPFRQNIDPLVSLLLEQGYTVQIETNGTLPPPTDQFYQYCSTDITQAKKCFVVCSPKAGRINPETEKLICAYKYVMAHDRVAEDGLPVLALDHSAHPCVARPAYGDKPIYLQPCDDKDNVINAANLKACIGSVMRNNYILQLQVHKLIGVE